VRRVEDVRLDPARRGAHRRREARRQLEHARTEVDADDLVRAKVPERERVASAGTLQVDRPAASAVQVAEELQFRREEVVATRRDQLDGLVEPALVALRGLVPGVSVGGVHAAHIGPLVGRGGTDVRVCFVGGHARESTTDPDVDGS